MQKLWTTGSATGRHHVIILVWNIVLENWASIHLENAVLSV